MSGTEHPYMSEGVPAVGLQGWGTPFSQTQPRRGQTRDDIPGDIVFGAELVGLGEEGPFP